MWDLYWGNIFLWQEISFCDRRCFPVDKISSCDRKFLSMTGNFYLWLETSSCDRKNLPVTEISSCDGKIFLWHEVSSIFYFLWEDHPSANKTALILIMYPNLNKSAWFLLKTLPENSRLPGKILATLPTKIPPCFWV